MCYKGVIRGKRRRPKGSSNKLASQNGKGIKEDQSYKRETKKRGGDQVNTAQDDLDVQDMVEVEETMKLGEKLGIIFQDPKDCERFFLQRRRSRRISARGEGMSN